jgi:hypothetical protein
VPRFLAGFLTASLVWGGLIFAQVQGLIHINLEPEEESELAGAQPQEAPDDSPDPQRKKRGGRKRATADRDNNKDRRLTGDALSGDDLGDPELRNLNADQAGGEEQLLGSEIERGFDSVFPQVRRCLMLAAGDEPVSGKIVFGLRIAGQGGVTAVNLEGPAAITRSEAGDCLRKAAKGIRFRSFNGPDMVVHYPLTLN